MPRLGGKGYRQRPLRRYGFFVAVAGLLALLLLQTSPRLSQGVEPVRTAASDQLFHVTRPSLIDRISGASAKERQILELESRVRELAQYKALALTMAERLEVYEDILNMQGEPGGAEVTARIMAETNGPFAEALLANAGATNGVLEGYFAENDRGLVGRVVQVGQRSSRILKITDFNSRVPVMGEASGLRAIMYGGRDGLGRLTDLPEQGDFLPNERILTSGEGGLFPRGVVVGHVRDAEGKEIRVDLEMLNGQLSYVRLKPIMSIPVPEAFPVETEVAELTDEDGS
ncbi:MAG: rod shape-determining protein MreC [Hyphomonas sp.]|jgi:rod shape-determining protein MreC|nr:rod shape-determining protein MreC [Henriciella sp.]MBO6694428.1 rod shape-determining protein MreC [Henriciella sp.]MCR9225311.1 rod shape-determining protein MreC [Hyphomonas sp.]